MTPASSPADQAKAMNAALLPAYSALLEELRQLALQVNGRLSAPLVLDVPPGYVESRVRLMVIGQETHGWGAPSQEAYASVEALRARYSEFALGAKYRSSPFWQAADHLHDCLNGNVAPRHYLWSNLAKADVNRERAPRSVTSRLEALGTVRVEIAVTQPDVVVFLTGPNYDPMLRAVLPGAEHEQLERGLQRLHGIEGTRLAFRTYHPRYLRLSRRWALLDRIVAEVRMMMDPCSPASASR